MSIDVKSIIASNAPTAKMWKEHFDIMDVHLNAEKPEELLKTRRPKESEDKDILSYRLKNFRHRGKSLFDRALDVVIEILHKSNIDYRSNSKRVKDFLSTYRKYSSGKYYSLKEWLFTDSVRYSELDSSASFIVIPISDNPLVPSFESEIPKFSPGKPIKSVDILMIPSHDIVINNEELFIFKAGYWTWMKDDKGKESREPYYFIYSKNQVDISYPKKEENKKSSKYETVGYYATNMGKIPLVIAGNRFIDKYDDAKKKKHKIFVSNFFSAAQIADEYYGEISDTKLIGTKFFPIRYQYETDCKAGCIANEANIYCTPDGGTCQSCKGKGKIIDFAPGDIYMMDKPNALEEGTADIKSPIGYANPPTDLLTARYEIDEKFYVKIATELCINLEQNMTAQSGESKKYDKEYKVTFYSNIVEAKLMWFEQLLIFIEMLLEYKTETTTKVIRPKKWDVQSREEILANFTAMKQNNVPDIVMMDSIREVLKAQIGYDERSLKVVDFIMLKDKLVLFGGGDLLTAKSYFGANITQYDIDVHRLMYMVINQVLIKNPEMELSYKNLSAAFDAEIKPYLTTVAPTFE